MKIEIDREELDALREKARTLDSLIRHRLEHGQVPSEVRIDVLDVSNNMVTLRIHDAVLTTPFGNFTVHDAAGGGRSLSFRAGNHVVLTHLVKLTIN